ncbi:3-dehydrosphinganine reductase TSC10A-like isoform X2 [Fagus crenata]
MADPNLSYLSLLLLLLPLAILLSLYFLVRPRPVKIPIKGRHVFITGGSSGIGLALAHQAASDGARVSILARSISKLEEAKQAIRLSTGIDVAVFAADVRDYDAVSKAINEAEPIDVLIVNQGVFVPQELEKQGLDEIRFMMDVNLMGTFHMIKAALPSIKKRSHRGPASIALMSSQAGQFGLRGLAEALQQELIADDIHVSLIFPPDTDTPGLVEETKVRPQLTSIIAASSGAMKADEVAKKALSGIKSGSFIIPCNFEGLLLSIATAGFAPQRSFVMAFVEIVAAGIIRFATLCFQWNWDLEVHDACCGYEFLQNTAVSYADHYKSFKFPLELLEVDFFLFLTDALMDGVDLGVVTFALDEDAHVDASETVSSKEEDGLQRNTNQTLSSCA